MKWGDFEEFFLEVFFGKDLESTRAELDPKEEKEQDKWNHDPKVDIEQIDE